MKVSASSSILLASLALSSSSSCLAAPAGESNQTTLSASSTTTQVSSASSAAPVQPTEQLVTDGSNILMEESPQLQSRDNDTPAPNVVDAVSHVPILGPALGKVFSDLAHGGCAISSVNPQDLSALSAASQEVSRNLQAALSVAPNIAAVNSSPDSSGSTVTPSASSTPADSGPTQSVQNVGSQSSSSAASTAVASPQMPANPPNSPVSVPSLPVNA